MHIRSTEKKQFCEWCGKETRNVHAIMGKHVRGCDGVHAYKAHRQNALLENIIQGAADRAKGGVRKVFQQAGQGLVEYALILVLVAVVVTIALALLGPAVGNVFSGIVSNI